MNRGVEVLRLKNGLAASRAKSVKAPRIRTGARFASAVSRPVSSLVDTGDPNRFVRSLFEQTLRSAAAAAPLAVLTRWRTAPTG